MRDCKGHMHFSVTFHAAFYITNIHAKPQMMNGAAIVTQLKKARHLL